MLWTMLRNITILAGKWLWSKRGVAVILCGVAFGILVATRLCFDGLKEAIPQSMASEVDVARAAWGLTRVMLSFPIGMSIERLIVAWGATMLGDIHE